ncbi:MAG: hypothetical protein J5710_15610 [Treponema sp.]|nr:hypothetical protein [Treponema sp.]
MKGIRMEYRACPECTYPLRSYMSIEGEITYVVSKCSNCRCTYTRKRKVKDKKVA